MLPLKMKIDLSEKDQKTFQSSLEDPLNGQKIVSFRQVLRMCLDSRGCLVLL